MINGISNSFAATIDGLTNFEISSLTVDELDAEIINVETEIFTPIVVLKDGVNTTTMSQSGLQTIIQNDENLGTMTFNCKGPFGANVQSLTLSYLTTTVNTSVLQVNGRVQPNTIRFPDGVTVGDKVVYLRGEDYDAFGDFIGYNIYKDYKVTFRNSPDDTGDLFYNIPVGYAHTFSYGDTSYVNILSIRSNGDIVYTDITGNKITYYTGFSTEIATTNILRHIVPSSASHRFMVGTTDIMTIDATGVNVLVTTGNIALKDAANTFTLTNTFPRINFTDAFGTKLQYYTGYTTEIQSTILRHNVPTGATHNFSINSSDRVTISNTEINVNASNSTSGSPKLVFWKHVSNSGRDSYIVRSGVNLIYSTGETGASSYHLFQIGIPAATNVFSIGDVGASLERGNLIMNTGDIRFPATATTKIQYYGAGGGYSTEVAAGILRQISPSQHIWKVGSVDTLTLSATALTCEEVIYAKNAMRTDDALFLYDQTILSPVNRSRLYHYNTNLYIENLTIGGLTFIQARNALGNAVDIFEVNIDECNITAPNGLNIIGNGGLNLQNGVGYDAIIRMEQLGSYPYLYIKNLEPSGWITFECRNASNLNALVMDLGYQEVWLYGVTRVCQDNINYGLHTLFTQTNAVFDMQNDVNSGSINVKLRDAGGTVSTPLALTSTNVTLKNTDVNGNLTVTGSITSGGSGVALLPSANVFTNATNTFKKIVSTGVDVTTNGLIRFYDASNNKTSFIDQYVYSMEVANESYDASGNHNISFFVRDTPSTTSSKVDIRKDNTYINNILTCEGGLQVKNITLPSTWIAKTPGTQLGGRSSGTQVTASQTFSNNVVYNLVSLALTPGVYMVYGLASYYVQTAGTITQEEITIGEGASGIFQNALTRDFNPNMSVGYPVYPIRSLNTYYEVTASTTLHLNVRLLFSSGTYQRNSTSATNCILDAIRIA